jgi:hypothetical protein
MATVTAFSGGASAKIENIRVGSAAAERVLLSAAPQTLGANGGTSEISARVEDVAGAGVPGIVVTFTADVGALSAGTAVTDDTGVAKVNLTTTRQTIVTANVAGKTATVTVALNPRTGIAISGPTTAIPAGTPASFQVNINAQANIRDVRVNWGDGSQQSLGALSAQTPVTHIFNESGTFTVTATAVDAANFTETVATTVTVLPAQPPSVLVQPSNTTPFVNEEIVVRATVSGNTSSIIRYEWNFGSGTNGPQVVSTTGNQVTVSWSTATTKTISVTVFQASGPSGNGFASVNVRGSTATAK